MHRANLIKWKTSFSRNKSTLKELEKDEDEEGGGGEGDEGREKERRKEGETVEEETTTVGDVKDGEEEYCVGNSE